MQFSLTHCYFFGTLVTKHEKAGFISRLLYTEMRGIASSSNHRSSPRAISKTKERLSAPAAKLCSLSYILLAVADNELVGKAPVSYVTGSNSCLSLINGTTDYYMTGEVIKGSRDGPSF